MKRPEYFVYCKSFQGKLEKYEVLNGLLTKITEEHKSFKEKELLAEYMKSYFMYRYWSKCEWEFIIVDWPYKDKVEDSNPIKIDVWDQIQLNFSVIIDLVWNYLKNE